MNIKILKVLIIIVIGLLLSRIIDISAPYLAGITLLLVSWALLGVGDDE